MKIKSNWHCTGKRAAGFNGRFFYICTVFRLQGSRRKRFCNGGGENLPRCSLCGGRTTTNGPQALRSKVTHSEKAANWFSPTHRSELFFKILFYLFFYLFWLLLLLLLLFYLLFCNIFGWMLAKWPCWLSELLIRCRFNVDSFEFGGCLNRVGWCRVLSDFISHFRIVIFNVFVEIRKRK